jgi:hypothetical protein
MRVLPSTEGWSGSAEIEPVEELAGRVRPTGAVASARWLAQSGLRGPNAVSGLRGPNAQSGAAFAGERR